MKIKMQPREIQVSTGNPFEEDRLGRETAVHDLAKFISSVETPCVISIDSAWGNGKTTFLRMLDQYLDKTGIPVVNFNAWEADLFTEPFTALVAELKTGLQKLEDEATVDSKHKISSVLKEAKGVVRARAPRVLRAIVEELPGFGEAFGEIMDGIMEVYVDKQMTAYTEVKTAVAKFKESLANVSISTWSKASILVIMIDELDRCRPSYAVELLEVAKHLFSAKNVVFVLAVNRKELAHSIQAVYGVRFDADAYLDRFFDLELRLPDPDRSTYIGELIRQVGIENHLKRTKDKASSQEFQALESLLTAYFGDSALNLRVISRSIHNLGMIYASLSNNQWFQGVTTSVLMILRAFDRELYYRFVTRRASDADAIDGIFTKLSDNFRDNHHEESCMLEARLIACQLERDSVFEWTLDEFTFTPRLRYFQSVLEDDKRLGSASQKMEAVRARKVIELLELFKEDSQSSKCIRFEESVKRIDLFSNELDVIQSLPLN